MRPAYLGRVDIREAVRPELTVSFAVNRSGNHNPIVARIAHTADVFLRVRRIADEGQLHLRRDLFEGLAHLDRMVLRLQAADVEEILAWLEAQFCHLLRACYF